MLLIALAAVAVLAHHLVADVLAARTYQRASIPVRFLTAILLVLLAWGVLAVHEAGHLLAGVASGFRVVLYVVGPLRIERQGERLRLTRNSDTALYGGAVICAPVWFDELERRFLLLVAGGPLTSLATGAAALVLWTGIRTPGAPLGPWPTLAALILIFFGIASLAIGIGTAVPSLIMGQESDGARIMRLAANDAVARRDAAVMALSALSVSGVRAGEWPPALLTQAGAVTDGSLNELIARMLVYRHDMERGHRSDGHAQLQRALNVATALPAVYRGMAQVEASYFEAAVRRDPESARRWLHMSAHSRSLAAAIARRRAEAAIASEEGNAPRLTEIMTRLRAEASLTFDAAFALECVDSAEALAHRDAPSI